MCRGLNSPYIGVQDKCPVSIQLHGVIVHHMVDIMWIIITWSTVGWREAELVGGRRLSPVGGAGGYGLLFYYRLDLWPWTRHAHLTVRWGHTLYCYILVVCVVNWKLVCHFLHAFLGDNTTLVHDCMSYALYCKIEPDFLSIKCWKYHMAVLAHHFTFMFL